MAESWQQRLKREAREMDAAVRSLLMRGLGDEALRDALEALSTRPRFQEFCWLWGPAVSTRNRALFRPFILNHFSSWPMDARAKGFNAWKKGETAEELHTWLEEADRRDDVEVFRKLYSWRLQQLVGPGKAEAQWRKDLLERLRKAQGRAALNTVLAKLDVRFYSLDEPTALAVYELCRSGARDFILDHLPRFWFVGRRGDPKLFWRKLMERVREAGDSELHLELYRRMTPQDLWRKDVLALCKSEKDAGRLVEELEKRHLEGSLLDPGVTATTFIELVEARGRDVVPYLLRHAHSVFPRWRFWGRRSNAKGLPELLELALRNGWLDVWSTLLRISATEQTWNAELRRLLEDRQSPEAEVRQRLLLLAGAGAEANFPGVSFAQVQPLEDPTAVALYERFPDLMRGPFRLHASAWWYMGYPQLTAKALARKDEPLIDYLASRAAIQELKFARQPGQWEQTIAALAAHYEALPEEDGTFARRASNALSMMPAYSIRDYDGLLRSNRLARLLFERSTNFYLSDERTVRDLLESPQIHVQALAFRVLGQDDARARSLAAENLDLLQATLLRPLHRRTRLMAFAALRNAAMADESAARRLLGRMKETLALPDKRYPKEQLVGLMGQVLHRWPSLRASAERPRVYGEAAP
jgi:hypothetical protein